ncbi:MAG: alpha/beta hydrolase [Bacteroidetes bacterium]|nr:alpha/beta hydrolase [Bacteroidota bacterium]
MEISKAYLAKQSEKTNTEAFLPVISKPVREEYIEVEPNVRLHITDAGEGKPIVLLHGWPLSNEMYEYQYNDLVNNNFRVIGITLRGFGKSGKPFGEYNYDIYANDIKKVLCKLNITGAVLGGFSMGGAIAIRFASTDNGAHVSKLALFGVAAPIWTQRDDYPYNFSEYALNELIELNYRDRPQLLTNVGKIFAATETSLSLGINSWLLGLGLNSSSHAMAQSLIALRDTDLRNDLAAISIPTLIMHGKKDKICTFQMAEEMKSRLINSYLIPFENSGHALLLEESVKFNKELIRFAT